MTDYFRTPSDSVLVKQSIPPQSISTATVNGTGVDTQGYESMLVIANAGAVGTSIAVKLQESSDDGDADAYADITDATTGAVTDADEPYIMDVNLSEYERYIRAVATAVGVVLVGVVFVLGSGRHLPPSQDNTPTQVGYDQLA
jgi:hypothetical protein